MRAISVHFPHRSFRLRPTWCGKGIAIHKPVEIGDDGEPVIRSICGTWRLTHIPTGLALGDCKGNLARAKSFALRFDDDFALVRSVSQVTPQLRKAWTAAKQEMAKRPKPPLR